MITKPDTTVASGVHQFTGSSPSTGTAPRFEPIASAASAQHQPDVELIDLAERVTALAKREHRACTRRVTIEDHVQEIMDRRPAAPEIASRTVVTDRSTETEHVMVVTSPRAPEPEDARLTDWRRAVEAHERREEALHAHFGLPSLVRRIDRTFRRLVRWTERLTAMAPQTSAGLAAKAAASLAIVEGNAYQWVTDLRTAVACDALRLATAGIAPPATDTALSHLASEHERLAVIRDASSEVLDRAEDAFVEVPLPDALRFREATDAASIGGYQNLDEPYGYTDDQRVEQLRTFQYSRPEHQQRRDEIVAAYDQWRADRQARWNATGLPEAWDKAMADAKVASTVRRDMIDRPALTMDGIWSKVGVALSCYQGIEGIQEELAELANSSSGETMLLSIMVDLCRMLMARRTAETASAACSNIVEVPLTVCADPVPMTPSLEIVESYRTFLNMEFRFLNWETHRSPDPVGGIWLDNPAGAFHGLDCPPPSSRAAAVLGVLGLMPGQSSAEDKRDIASVAA